MCALTVIRQGPSMKVIISACLSLRLIQTCGASAIAFVMLLGVEGGYSSENALAMLTQVKARAIAFFSLKSTEKR